MVFGTTQFSKQVATVGNKFVEKGTVSTQTALHFSEHKKPFPLHTFLRFKSNVRGIG